MTTPCKAGSKPLKHATAHDASTASILDPQDWVRDAPGPVLSLGQAGSFDDTHVLSPCVTFDAGTYRMWYSGSSGDVARRAYRIGLATSADGVDFVKDGRSPVLCHPDASKSLLTPALLRRPDGSLLRQGEDMYLWCIGADFATSAHDLHLTTSRDGVTWSPLSGALLHHVYAPSVIHDGRAFRMWYTDISQPAWCIRHASSQDGMHWNPSALPCLTIDQAWEHGRLFYPIVVRDNEQWLMWYGSYSTPMHSHTAMGFAVSMDGLHWTKSPHNPMIVPDASRAWESHYNTSGSILKLPDGSWRIWYASRKSPPHVNKYFAIATARWKGWPAGSDAMRNVKD